LADASSRYHPFLLRASHNLFLKILEKNLNLKKTRKKPKKKRRERSYTKREKPRLFPAYPMDSLGLFCLFVFG